MPARRQGPGRASRRRVPDGAAPTTVRLATPTGTIDVAWPKPGTDDVKELQRQAIRWTHVVRNRARWIGTPSLARQQDENARAFLAFLGINDAQREQFAHAGTIRVSVPYTEEQQGWEARILPWEFLLSAGTRDLRTGSLVVSRSLLQQRRPPAAVPPTARSSSSRAPRAPRRRTGTSRTSDGSSSSTRGRTPNSSSDSTPPLARSSTAAVKKFHPDIVHLAGFDTHQGLELLKDPRADRMRPTAISWRAPEASSRWLRSISPRPSHAGASRRRSSSATSGTRPRASRRCWSPPASAPPSAFRTASTTRWPRSSSATSTARSARRRTRRRASRRRGESLQTQPKPTARHGDRALARPALRRRPAAAAFPHARPRERASRGDLARDGASRARRRELFAITRRARAAVLVRPAPQQPRSVPPLPDPQPLRQARIVGVQVFVELHSNEGTYPYRQSFNDRRPGARPLASGPHRPHLRPRAHARRGAAHVALRADQLGRARDLPPDLPGHHGAGRPVGRHRRRPDLPAVVHLPARSRGDDGHQERRSTSSRRCATIRRPGSTATSRSTPSWRIRRSTSTARCRRCGTRSSTACRRPTSIRRRPTRWPHSASARRARSSPAASAPASISR